MKTDLGTVVPADTWDALYTEALECGQIMTNFSPATNAGFQNFCVWPSIDGARFIVLIRGES